MRKRIINPALQKSKDSDPNWLDIEKRAIVEVTSEEEAFPIESALLPDKVSGWRASSSGKQVIRLLFDKPQRLQCINLMFEELNIERTQEYVLRWSSDDGQPSQEIVRQQWNFIPDGASSQVENYYVDLPAVTLLELTITPDISDNNELASIEKFRLAYKRITICRSRY